MIHDIILFLVGIIVGAMNAIAGGGMLIGFPVMIAFGLPPLIANATANITVMPGGLSSAYAYRRYLRRVPRLYMLLLVPVAIGAAIGATILRRTSFTSFESFVPALILFAVALFAFQPLLHYQLHKHIHTHGKRPNWQAFIIISLAIVPLSLYGGYFGAGFGFIMLAFLGFTSMHDFHQMTALKNLAGATIALVSILCLFSAHLINWHIGVVMAVGNCIGGYVGALMVQKVSNHVVRIIVIVIGLSTATYLGLKSW